MRHDQLIRQTDSWGESVETVPHAAESDGRIRVTMKGPERPLGTQQETGLTTSHLLEEPTMRKIRHLVLGKTEKIGSLR